MSGSFSITISSLSVLNIGGSKRAEASEIEDMVVRALHVMSSSHQTSITLRDRAGNIAGTMSWTPVNSA